ncbi:hypothetical protein GCM10025868_24460 [Angustibacter aerolatus]|uniref:Uncharacterized protein n=1 Tax=Angustibacter aerolatus TaxID=1162965 RepID=A0ABQ6JI37_9ACTN|nr:hypothetical protein GCM10025868_24460 [Angustibacter aerolatus]
MGAPHSGTLGWYVDVAMVTESVPAGAFGHVTVADPDPRRARTPPGRAGVDVQPGVTHEPARDAGDLVLTQRVPRGSAPRRPATAAPGPRRRR